MEACPLSSSIHKLESQLKDLIYFRCGESHFFLHDVQVIEGFEDHVELVEESLSLEFREFLEGPQQVLLHLVLVAREEQQEKAVLVQLKQT